MRIGLMMTPPSDLREVTRTARKAEELGYDFLASGEHVFFHEPMPNAFVTLAAAAAVTNRARLLSALTVLPLYPAALAAKMIATLDRIAGGRFDLGVGIGGEYPAEFAACGVKVSDRARLADDALQLFARLFRGEEVRGQRLAPLPLQRPGPPVWVGGRSPAAMLRAARFGSVWIPYLCTPERLSDGLRQISTYAQRHGRSAGAVCGAVMCWGAVGTDGRQAHRLATEMLSSMYQQDLSGRGSYVVAGTPNSVVARLREFADAGAEHVLFAPACHDGALRTRMITMFANEVIPALQATRTGR